MQDKADTEDPMAYLAFATDGSESCAVYVTDGEAQAAADAWGWKIAPLYLAPRLTDAEREAVEWFANYGYSPDGVPGRAADTLRGLLVRMSADGDCPEADKAARQDTDHSQFAKRESDSPQPIADSRLAALQALAELDEELGLPCTPNPHATPGECRVSPQCTADGEK